MASAFQTAAEAIMAEYAEGLKRQIETPLFWDRAFGPPDKRPIYGPDAPRWMPDGACGYIDCRCCNAWADNWDEHYCY